MCLVLIEGLEPTRLSTREPKSRASANFTISAWVKQLPQLPYCHVAPTAIVLYTMDLGVVSKSCQYIWLAGVARIELTDARIKIWCLAIWRHSSMLVG